MAPATMKAVVVVAKGEVALKEIPVPQPGPEEVLVKVAAIAQNPTDWKHVEWGGGVGSVVGCDFAGTVEALGSDVPASGVKVGDRVASFVHGATPNEQGSFAEYTTCSAGMLVQLPAEMSFEEGAGLGIGGFTACQVLYQTLGLPTPLEPVKKGEGFSILVWSGASGVGQLVIQLAALAGLTVYTTASPKHHAYLQSLGATACYPYSDPNVGAEIRAATDGKLKYAVDCIGDDAGAQAVSDALSEEGGKVALIINYETKRPEVEVVHSLAYTLMPHDVTFPMKKPVDPKEVADGQHYAQLLSTVLAQPQFAFKVVKPKVLPHGLASVAEGLQLHKAGGVSGEKLTYRIADTPA